MIFIETSTSFLPIAPDLVVEVVSPSDSFSDVESKASQWFIAGSSIVLVADPKNQTMLVHKNQADVKILRSGEIFHCGDVCNNWQLFFEEVYS